MFNAQAKATILSYEAFFSAIGFDPEVNAGKPDALKVFFAGKISAAEGVASKAAVDKVLKDLNLTAAADQTASAAIKAALDAKDAKLGIYTAGLEAAGVKPAAQKDKELTSADVKAAIDARSSQKGAAIAAATGHEPITQAAGGDELSGASAAELRGQYSKLVDAGKPAEASAFWARNVDKMYPES